MEQSFVLRGEYTNAGGAHLVSPLQAFFVVAFSDVLEFHVKDVLDGGFYLQKTILFQHLSGSDRYDWSYSSFEFLDVFGIIRGEDAGLVYAFIEKRFIYFVFHDQQRLQLPFGQLDILPKHLDVCHLAPQELSHFINSFPENWMLAYVVIEHLQFLRSQEDFTLTRHNIFSERLLDDDIAVLG